MELMLFILGRDSSGYSQKEWDSWFECVQYMAKNVSNRKGV